MAHFRAYARWTMLEGTADLTQDTRRANASNTETATHACISEA